jgi:hypothetical protein
MDRVPKDEMLPDAIICDLDGTLALLYGRNPYDASTCADDVPNKPVALVLEALKGTHHVLLVSGREDKYREQTVEFWRKHFHWDFRGLFMRPTGNTRNDASIKREIFEKEIRGKYNVAFVLDDRPQVVRMWRYDLGLTVMQLNDKEF